jgi:hypothetical protein
VAVSGIYRWFHNIAYLAWFRLNKKSKVVSTQIPMLRLDYTSLYMYVPVHIMWEIEWNDIDCIHIFMHIFG